MSHDQNDSNGQHTIDISLKLQFCHDTHDALQRHAKRLKFIGYPEATVQTVVSMCMEGALDDMLSTLLSSTSDELDKMVFREQEAMVEDELVEMGVLGSNDRTKSCPSCGNVLENAPKNAFNCQGCGQKITPIMIDGESKS